MITLGITGRSGCGKSTVTSIFAAHGVPLADADQMSREILLPGSPLLPRLAERFGEDILRADGTLDRRLLREFEENANRDLHNVLEHLAPRLMAPVLAERSGIPADRKVHSITKAERRRLLETMKGLQVEIRGPRPIAEAIVTSGGVKTAEVDPGTLASKRLPGVFFAGEVLDVDAYTGGFNLQIAWSTGHAAGEGAAQYCQGEDA